ALSIKSCRPRPGCWSSCKKSQDINMVLLRLGLRRAGFGFGAENEFPMLNIWPRLLLRCRKFCRWGCSHPFTTTGSPAARAPACTPRAPAPATPALSAASPASAPECPAPPPHLPDRAASGTPAAAAGAKPCASRSPPTPPLADARIPGHAPPPAYIPALLAPAPPSPARRRAVQ